MSLVKINNDLWIDPKDVLCIEPVTEDSVIQNSCWVLLSSVPYRLHVKVSADGFERTITKFAVLVRICGIWVDPSKISRVEAFRVEGYEGPKLTHIYLSGGIHSHVVDVEATPDEVAIGSMAWVLN